MNMRREWPDGRFWLKLGTQTAPRQPLDRPLVAIPHRRGTVGAVFKLPHLFLRQGLHGRTAVSW